MHKKVWFYILVLLSGCAHAHHAAAAPKTASPSYVTAADTNSENAGDAPSENSQRSSSSRASAGKMQLQVERSQAPKSVDRVDRARFPNEKDQVHFKDGSALNYDGTWKHSSHSLTNAEKKWLTSNGWGLP